MAPGVQLIAKASYICENLFRHCVCANDGIKRIKETGSVAPGNNLKALKTRRAFSWVRGGKFSRKFFTLASVRLAIQLLVDKKGLEIPVIPSLPYDSWLEQQARIVCHLCQRCRRNSGSVMRFAGYKQSQLSTMDWAETVPLEVRCFT